MSDGAAWRSGLWAAAPLAPGVISVGVLYGVTATEAGMPAWSVIATSLVVATGTAQFLALELLGQGYAWWLAALAGLLVNVRYAVYALHLGLFARPLPILPRLAYLAVVSDEGFALTTPLVRSERGGKPSQLKWSAAVMAVVWLAWQLGTVVGATAGRIVPDDAGLEMAIPLTLVAVLALLTSSRRHAIVALVAGAVAIALHQAPFGLGLIAGMAAGVATGLALPGPKSSFGRASGATAAEPRVAP